MNNLVCLVSWCSASHRAGALATSLCLLLCWLWVSCSRSLWPTFHDAAFQFLEGTDRAHSAKRKTFEHTSLFKKRSQISRHTIFFLKLFKRQLHHISVHSQLLRKHQSHSYRALGMGEMRRIYIWTVDYG